MQQTEERLEVNVDEMTGDTYFDELSTCLYIGSPFLKAMIHLTIAARVRQYILKIGRAHV